MKIILLGDSITQGLGSKKVNFTEELSNLCCQDQIVNMALTGTTITYASERLNIFLEEKPEIVIILYGNVDAQLKPSRTGHIFKMLPSRFAHADGSMLLPRPFYSHTWYKNWGQHIENWMRTIFRKLIYLIDGTEQWVSITEFIDEYRFVCKSFRDHDIRVICCSTVAIDEKLFPGSNAEYIKYNDKIKEIAEELGCIYLDIYARFNSLIMNEGWKGFYNYDHFHPNGKGYQLMAKWIYEGIERLKEGGFQENEYGENRKESVSKL